MFGLWSEVNMLGNITHVRDIGTVKGSSIVYVGNGFTVVHGTLPSERTIEGHKRDWPGAMHNWTGMVVYGKSSGALRTAVDGSYGQI